MGDGLVVLEKGEDLGLYPETQSRGHGETELKILEAKAGGKLGGDHQHGPRLLKDKGTLS